MLFEYEESQMINYLSWSEQEGQNDTLHKRSVKRGNLETKCNMHL